MPNPSETGGIGAPVRTMDKLRNSPIVQSWGMPIFFLAALVGIPLLYVAGAIDIVTVNQFGRFACFAIVAVGVDLIWGYTGILTLCQAMFFCFGGYAMGMHLAMKGPLDGEGIPRCLFVVTSEVSGFKLPWFWQPFDSLWLSLFFVVAVPGIFAYIFGYFAFRSRVRGVYFSIITQATTLAACLVFRRNEMRLCGTNGLTNFKTLAGFDLGETSARMGLYLISVLTLIGVYYLCKHIVQSRLGRLLIAIRDNESRLRFSGYRPLSFKVFAFVLAAVIAAIGGALYTPQNGIITPYKMEPGESIIMVVWVALGGRGTLSGAVVGAILFSFLSSMLTSNLPNAWPFVLGAIAVLVVLFMPRGLAGLLMPPEDARPVTKKSEKETVAAKEELTGTPAQQGAKA
jgi:urea transport system permease protein